MAFVFWRVLIVSVALLLVLSGCQRDQRAASSAIRDDAGRVVQLEQEARRIVSLAPPFTELLFAIGAGERIVGRTRWDEDPPAARSVPSVGDGLGPNIEAVVAREPDLVAFYLSPSNAQAIERLDAMGIASASFRLDRIADFRRTVRALAQLTGATAEADSALAQFEREMRSAGASVRRSVRPTVLILAWDNPPIVIGGGSFLSELVFLAGGRNTFGDLERPSAQVSIETIAARDPAFVLVTGNELPPPFAQRAEWRVVEAVRARRFVAVDGTEFAWPSFRTPAAVRELRAALERVAR